MRYPFEAGGDAKIGITQGLMLALTLNTDFAQVEVDEQQVDLTRFSLFFPEKRPFFLESAGLFAVGTNQAAQLFFSRRIGISDSGSPVPIRGGARLTGRAGGFDVGLLHIRTDEVTGVQGANGYSVARVSRELGNRSQIGALFTERSATGSDDFGRTYGIDGRLGLREEFTFTAVLGTTDRPNVSSSQEVAILSADYTARSWQSSIYYHQIGANFRPDVGFLRRPGFRAGGVRLLHNYRTAGTPWLREIRPHTNYDVSYTLDGFKQTEVWHLDVHVQWENGALFSPATDYVYDGLDEEEEIAPGISVPAGEYGGWVWAPRFNTSTRLPLIFRAGANLGSFLTGTRKYGFGTLEFRQGETLAGSVTLEHNKVDLEEGSFDATLARGRVGYSFTPNLFIQTLFQYGTQTKIWSGNVRLGWLDKAGTGLFVVYNERQTTDDLIGPLERSFLIKFTRQFDVAGASRDLLGW